MSDAGSGRQGRRSRGHRAKHRVRNLIVDATPLRLDHDYRWWWSGQLVTAIGNQVTRTALRYQIFVLTGSVLAVGALTLVQFVAVLAFALIGGTIADAFDRRRVLLVAQVGMCATSLLLVVVSRMEAPPVPAIVLLAFVGAGLGSVDLAVRGSAVPRLVPRQRLPSALALNQLNGRMGAILGPAIGGVVIAAVGVPGAFALDAVTFIGSITALLVIKPIPPLAGAPRAGLAAIRQGLTFVTRRRLILSALAIDLIATILGTPTSLFPALALDVFKVGPMGFGVLSAAPAIGALIAMLLSGWIPLLRRTGRALILAVAGWGVAITAFGVLTFSFPLAVLALAIAGGADVIASVLRSTLVQFETPDELRGRVTSIYSMSAQSGSRLGDIEAAVLASIAGIQASIVLGGLLCLVGVLAIVRAIPELPAHTILVDPLQRGRHARRTQIESIALLPPDTEILP
jgi:MFS family permease